MAYRRYTRSFVKAEIQAGDWMGEHDWYSQYIFRHQLAPETSLKNFIGSIELPCHPAHTRVVGHPFRR
jgi:hypothetical protein